MLMALLYHTKIESQNKTYMILELRVSVFKFILSGVKNR